MCPPSHDRSDSRYEQVLNFRLAWAKSASCWPASFDIFDRQLAEYSIEFKRRFEKRPGLSPCSLVLSRMLLALGPTCCWRMRYFANSSSSHLERSNVLHSRPVSVSSLSCLRALYRIGKMRCCS
jgi:hypothetical protein